MALFASNMRPINRTSFFKFPQSRQRLSKEQQYDPSKGLHESLKEVLNAISPESNVSDRVRLNYLNLFVKIILQAKSQSEDCGYTNEELLKCLHFTLLNQSSEIRAASLRAIRHILKAEDDIIIVNKYRMPYLIARSLDLVLKNDTERVEALKIMRRILVLSPSNFDVSLARSLVALAHGGADEKSRMLRSCLGTLCELGVLNWQLFVESGGVGALTKNLLECQTPKIAESICGVLLLLLDKPLTRKQSSVDLHCVAAPYCDFHYVSNWKDKNWRDERELRFHSSRRALLTMLRSWPGIMHFCNPNDKIGLSAIIEALYLDELEVRKGVLDLLYDLFGLPQPEWTDEVCVALSAIDPSEPNSSWRLSEGFVVAEGRSVLPHLAKTTPNLIEAHIALLLYCFLKNGLLRALTEVIATGDTHVSLRATVFLGEILRLMQTLLPQECCNFCHPLPSLLEYAATNKPQALKAITSLQSLHKLLKKRPASYSLYLDYILKSGCFMKYPCKTIKKQRKLARKKTKLPQFISKDEDNIIKETGVLLNKDAYTWDWNLITMLLKGEYDFRLDLLDSGHRQFVDRLVEFYMPSSNRYSHMDLGRGAGGGAAAAAAYTATGLALAVRLARVEGGAAPLLRLCADVRNHVTALSAGGSVHDCLFSPQHMAATQCQTYFLFVGRLAATEPGAALLATIDMFGELERLAKTTNNDCYVKLIVSSLDYSQPGPSRQLLTAVLACPNESSRLYATEFLLVVLRAGVPDFAGWGVRLLIKQLADESSAVRSAALGILHEACELADCLEALIRCGPDMGALGERASVLLRARMLSLPAGVEALTRSRQLAAAEEVERWRDGFNLRYVKLIEEELCDALTLHRSSEEGTYEMRTLPSSNSRELFVPAHLYGQLACHAAGFELLMKHGGTAEMLEIVKKGNCDSDGDIIKLKAALWALGHLSNSKDGFQYLEFHDFFKQIVSLAEKCSVYSIRATSYYVLCLIGTTSYGADVLSTFGWASTRHDRHSLYPVVDENNDSVINIRETSHVSCCDSSMTEEDSLLSTDDELGELLESDHSDVKSPTSVDRKSFPSHQRSLSETATSDFMNAGDSEAEDSSVHHSHRSHMSDRLIRFRERKTSTLGTIPSSPSYGAEEKPGKKVRRHSESCRRVSGNSANTSDSCFSFDSGSFGKVRNRDMLGYATIRSLRKIDTRLTDFDFSFTNRFFPSKNAKVRSSKRVKNNFLVAPSLLSVSSIKKYCVKGLLKTKGGGYLGISLPIDVLKLFPVDEYNKNKETDDNKNLGSPSILEIDQRLEQSDYMEYEPFHINTEKFLQHTAVSCLKCCAIPGAKNVPNPEHVIELLRQAEQLVNPGWAKVCKQFLLDAKQKRPSLFLDMCIYSEICNLLAVNAYRLMPRRMLHELFFSVSFTDKTAQNFDFSMMDFMEPPAKTENKDKKPSQNVTEKEAATEHKDQENSDDVGASRPLSSSFKMKTLESLKLTYKENKFPIKDAITK